MPCGSWTEGGNRSTTRRWSPRRSSFPQRSNQRQWRLRSEPFVLRHQESTRGHPIRPQIAISRLPQDPAPCDREMPRCTLERLCRHSRAVLRVAYHTLFYAHFYLQQDQHSFTPWARHREEANFLDAVPGGGPPKPCEPYTRDELLEYYTICDEMIDRGVDKLDLSAPQCGFPWYKMPTLEHQIVNIRHIQNHAAALATRLRRPPASASPGSRRDEVRESGSRSATATFSTQATLSERRKDARGYYRCFLLVGRMICPPGLQSEPAASASPKSTSTDRASSTTLFVGPGSGRLRTRRSRPPSVAACPGARLPPAVSDNDRLLTPRRVPLRFRAASCRPN